MRPWSHARMDGRRLTSPAMLGRVLLLLVLFGPAWPPPTLAVDAPAVPSAPVVVDGDTLFRVRGVTAFPAGERAGAIADRIVEVAANRGVPTSSLRVVETGRSSDVMMGDTVLVSVLDADAEIERDRKSVVEGKS